MTAGDARYISRYLNT